MTLCDFSYFPGYSVKYEPHCHATSVEFGSLHGAIYAGLSTCFNQFFISSDVQAQFPTCTARGAGVVGIYKLNPKHSKHHRQRDASQTTRWTSPLAKGNRPRPLVAHIANQPCVMWSSTRLFSKCLSRACGVNFYAQFTHPQTKPRALTMTSTPRNPLQKVKG
jgi:hypothetical protein